MSWASRLAVNCIERYQNNGGGEKVFYVSCNFSPTCSEYAKQSIQRFGFIQGGALSAKRIFRCTDRDLTQAIIDPVPEFLSHKRKR